MTFVFRHVSVIDHSLCHHEGVIVYSSKLLSNFNECVQAIWYKLSTSLMKTVWGLTIHTNVTIITSTKEEMFSGLLVFCILSVNRVSQNVVEECFWNLRLWDQEHSVRF